MQQSIPRLDYGLPWFEECKRITVYHASAQAQTPPTLLPSEMQSIGRATKKGEPNVYLGFHHGMSRGQNILIVSDSAHRLSHWIICDRINQPDRHRVPGMKFFRRNQHGKRSPFAHHLRQPLRPSPSGHQTECRSAMSENRMRRRDPSMTGQRQIKSPAHAVSVDRCIHAGRELCDCIHQILAHLRKTHCGASPNLLDFAEFSPRREKLRIACEDERLWSPL